MNYYIIKYESEHGQMYEAHDRTETEAEAVMNVVKAYPTMRKIISVELHWENCPPRKK